MGVTVIIDELCTGIGINGGMISTAAKTAALTTPTMNQNG